MGLPHGSLRPPTGACSTRYPGGHFPPAGKVGLAMPGPRATSRIERPGATESWRGDSVSSTGTLDGLRCWPEISGLLISDLDKRTGTDHYTPLRPATGAGGGCCRGGLSAFEASRRLDSGKAKPGRVIAASATSARHVRRRRCPRVRLRPSESSQAEETNAVTLHKARHTSKSAALVKSTQL